MHRLVYIKIKEMDLIIFYFYFLSAILLTHFWPYTVPAEDYSNNPLCVLNYIYILSSFKHKVS